METEKTRTGTTSKLLVTKAKASDSGTYTCDPSRGQPTTADVHIITGQAKYPNWKFEDWISDIEKNTFSILNRR